jgi:hypothetical protein
MVKLRNYTSGVPVERSVSFIEKRLVETGASHIMKEYVDGVLAGIMFSLPGPKNNASIPIKLPANVEKCNRLLAAQVKRQRKGTLEKIRDQAERTAWKLLADWVDVQVSMIRLGQAEPLEIFLPYLFDAHRKQTFYGSLKESGFKALPFTPSSM